jgi:hypothetical protein
MFPVLALLAEPDVDLLNEAARSGLDGMPGCHELSAEVTRTAWVGLIRDVEIYSLKGRLVDGAWQELSFEVLDHGAEGVQLQLDLGGKDYPFVPPMLGKLPEGSGGSTLASSVLDEVVVALAGDVETAWVSLDEIDGAEAYVLERTIEVDQTRNRDMLLRVWVEQGQQRARRWEASLPRGIPLGDGLGRLKKVLVVLDVDGQGLPSSESLAGTLRAGPIALRLRQEMDYQVMGACSE